MMKTGFSASHWHCFLSRPLLLLLLAAVACAPVSAQEPSTVPLASIDSIFQRFDGTRTPGCAVGVSDAHTIILERAYGMADLEHGVTNTAQTIFEPGSVAKQFTATATILLALDGELSLEDDIRKYIPELPDYDLLPHQPVEEFPGR